MIDRKRLTLIIAGAATLVLIIVALVIALILTGSKNQSESSNPNPSPGPEVTEEVVPETEAPTVTFSKEQARIVREVAQVATTWSGQTDPTLVTTRYTDAGMSTTLADSFTPLWAQAFDSETTAEVKSTKIGEPKVTDYISGKEDGTGIFVVSVVITYEGYAHKGGKTTSIGPAEATWQFALDERYNTVTQVIQPPLSEIEGLQ